MSTCLRGPLLGLALSVILAGVLVGCGSTGGGEGAVRVLLTDAPAADITEVHVRLTALRAVGVGGVVTLLSEADLPESIELVALAGDPLLLGQPLIPAGDYTQVRLELSGEPGANWIRTADGATYDLTVPSGPQTGVKLVTGAFTVPDGGTVTLLLDFQAQASVHRAGASGLWIMRPTLFASVVPGDSPLFGALEGTVLDDEGDPPQPPVDQVLGVFVEGPFGPVAVAQVSPDDGSFEVLSVLVGQYQGRLYWADLDWNPIGPALSFVPDGDLATDSLLVQILAGQTVTLTLALEPL